MASYDGRHGGLYKLRQEIETIQATINDRSHRIIMARTPFIEAILLRMEQLALIVAKNLTKSAGTEHDPQNRRCVAEILITIYNGRHTGLNKLKRDVGKIRAAIDERMYQVIIGRLAFIEAILSQIEGLSLTLANNMID